MQEIICTCGHLPEIHDEDGECLMEGCQCETFHLVAEEITVYDRLHEESGYYIRELKRARCSQCKKVMACTIVATALKVKKGQFIASLVIGRGNLLSCKDFCLLPGTNGREQRQRKHSNNGQTGLFGEVHFESRGEYALRHIK